MVGSITTSKQWPEVLRCCYKHHHYRITSNLPLFCQSLNQLNSKVRLLSPASRFFITTMSTTPTPVSTQKSPPIAVGCYSQAMICPPNSRMAFISGQLGLNPETCTMDTLESVRTAPPSTTNSDLPSLPAMTSEVEAQAYRALVNLRLIVEAAGGTTRQIVKINIYLADIDDFQKVDAIYSLFFKNHPAPSRVCMAVKDLPKRGLVEMDAIAALHE